MPTIFTVPSSLSKPSTESPLPVTARYPNFVDMTASVSPNPVIPSTPVISTLFFEHYPMLADKEYMYGEEETLQLCVKSVGLKSLYIPDVIVLHLHQKSSKEAFRDRNERCRFIAMNQKETWKEYLRLRKELDGAGSEKNAESQ